MCETTFDRVVVVVSLLIMVFYWLACTNIVLSNKAAGAMNMVTAALYTASCVLMLSYRVWWASMIGFLLAVAVPILLAMNDRGWNWTYGHEDVFYGNPDIKYDVKLTRMFTSDPIRMMLWSTSLGLLAISLLITVAPPEFHLLDCLPF